MDLQTFFQTYSSVSIAFSGGCDSAFLLHQAKKYAHRAEAFYVKSDFQPAFELEDAKRLCQELAVTLHILPVAVLSNPNVCNNNENRCYYCKKMLFSTIKEAAANLGFPVVCDGTNASDDSSNRPGMKALEELQILSPLRIAGLTKAEIRNQSEKLGLFTGQKPAYACLATRIEPNTPITREALIQIEKNETFLFHLGFKDFRIRSMGRDACIQLREEQFELFTSLRNEIRNGLKDSYPHIFLDLNPRLPSDGLKLIGENTSKPPACNPKLKKEVETWNPKLF